MKRIFNKYSIFAIFILLYIIWGNLIFPTIMQGSFFDIWDENFISLERVLLLLFHTLLGIVFVFIGLFILYKFLPLKKAIVFMYFYTLFPAFLYCLKYTITTETGWKLMSLIRASMFYPDIYHLVLNILFLIAIIVFSVLLRLRNTSNKKSPSVKEVLLILLYFIFIWEFPSVFNM